MTPTDLGAALAFALLGLLIAAVVCGLAYVLVAGYAWVTGEGERAVRGGRH